MQVGQLSSRMIIEIGGIVGERKVISLFDLLDQGGESHISIGFMMTVDLTIGSSMNQAGFLIFPDGNQALVERVSVPQVVPEADAFSQLGIIEKCTDGLPLGTFQEKWSVVWGSSAFQFNSSLLLVLDCLALPR